jgi:nitroreductase
MEVFEAVRTVLAVRAYQAKPVLSDIIRRIVEAGRLTASASNNQPWHFIVVENHDTLRQVVAIEQTKFAISDASRAIQSMILTPLVGRGRLELGRLPGASGGQAPRGAPL